MAVITVKGPIDLS